MTRVPMTRWLCGVMLQGLVATATFAAQPAPPFPMYSAEQVQTGMLRSLLTRSEGFEQAAAALSKGLRQDCAPGYAGSSLQRLWLAALVAWQTAATPASGAVLERRSHRNMDFWPARGALIAKAIESRPASVADLESIGSPAKGLPALEWLLTQPLTTESCGYAAVLSEAVLAEAQALSQATRNSLGLAESAQPDSDLATQAATDWLGQWLSAWERLRWTHMEQPITKARALGTRPAYARLSAAANRADWQAQWEALSSTAVLQPGQAASPPAGGRDLLPVQALLLSQGHIGLAARWAAAMSTVQRRFDQLGPRPSAADVRAVTRSMKTVTTMFQNEVAPAMNLTLGFSDADGD